MRVLILSCNTGAGHNSVAAAVKEYFEGKGEECEIFDALSFISEGFSQIISTGHSLLYRYFPELIGNGIKIAGEHEETLSEGTPERMLLDAGVNGLKQKLEGTRYDMVICSHMFASVMLSDVVKQGGYTGPTARIETDYMIDPGSAHINLDFTFLPSLELKAQWDLQRMPGKAVASGLPVRSAFYGKMEKPEAKRMLGISENSRHLVVMGGSMGAGPLPEIISYIVQNMTDEIELSIVCGNNRQLHKHLLETLPDSERIHLYGYCSIMPLLLDSAELYMTKPGGISITESAVKKVPMCLIDAVGGCEEPNMEYFTENMYAISGRKPKEIAQACIELLRNDLQRREMSYALEALANINNPGLIYDIMKGIVNTEC